MNGKQPREPENRLAMPIAVLVLAVYFGLGIVGGGAQRGWWF